MFLHESTLMPTHMSMHMSIHMAAYTSAHIASCMSSPMSVRRCAQYVHAYPQARAHVRTRVYLHGAQSATCLPSPTVRSTAHTHAHVHTDFHHACPYAYLHMCAHISTRTVPKVPRVLLLQSRRVLQMWHQATVDEGLSRIRCLSTCV